MGIYNYASKKKKKKKKKYIYFTLDHISLSALEKQAKAV